MMDQQVNLCLGGDLANLHSLGWIATDLHRLIELSDLLASGDLEPLERYFGPQARPSNRYKSFTANGHRPLADISLQDDGRLALNIPNLSVAGAIVMPLVQSAVTSLLKKTDTPAEFRLTPADPGLKRVMQAYERGDFGSGNDGCQTLAFVLTELNYEVGFLSRHAELIEHSVSRYATRIARTIRKQLRA
ncbi:hypothetical protein [Marinobacterium rhizophilum]|uniref:Uncharacterized protein n=1 Tax=Marinobacterium rhizophilum TaxID=420402 RepID=A0ABY5HHA4_9GAMM|nr:hypothetical protein [Marinobacterium rhizophilum]UTW11514.1 hypothetical protein KDW95_20025 [Marinobacterium rhizophilum]